MYVLGRHGVAIAATLSPGAQLHARQRKARLIDFKIGRPGVSYRSAIVRGNRRRLPSGGHRWQLAGDHARLQDDHIASFQSEERPVVATKSEAYRSFRYAEDFLALE